MKNFACLLLLFCLHQKMFGQNIIATGNASNSFPITTTNEAATIVFDAIEDSLIYKTVSLLQTDIEAVSGKKPLVSHSLPGSKNIIIVGNVHKSALIQQLIKAKKLNISAIKNKWEAYQIQLVKSPFKGVTQALVIAGNDRRGTAYGVLEISKQIGVSPWYWWADVPVKTKKEIYVKPNAFVIDSPKVKYRGIFINDEAPALSNWSKEKFGGFNHLFYEKVFELMLRLKANYLWPAMWGSAFYDDDSLNKQTADNYGIVIGTSHHEPLMRAHDEWRRYGKGKWNYDSNEVALQQFWKEGMQRATNEKIVSIGMRGDGDEPMTRETATALLERIVKDQRQIIADVTSKPASETPQLWALYKEVQDYHDKGMRVPDDVTLLLCDDNWGNIRKLPRLDEPKRKGGYGIYYHFDYVGGPRNYKWINTNNLARVWEQMHLAWAYGARQIWIVNVGDIKPMELPTSFFLDYAWNPNNWNEDNIQTYYTKWAAEQFGKKHRNEIGDILRKYSQYAARRKPELLDDKTYNFDEFYNVLQEWKYLLAASEKIASALPVNYKSAYFQLVLHPVKALTNLHELYSSVASNHSNSKDSNFAAANICAQIAKQLFIEDSLITQEYHQVNDGKWNHMMSQTHIGYTYWQQPPYNKLPDLTEMPVNNKTAMREIVDAATKTAKGPKNKTGNIFFESEGIASIEAQHWTHSYNSANIKWKTIPDIGKTGSGITTFPETVSTVLSSSSPHVEYEFYCYDTGKVNIQFYFSPTLNFHNTKEGLQFAVSVDNEKPQVFSLNKQDTSKAWETWVANNIIIKKSEHQINKPGKHILKYWMISPAVILQKAVIDFGGLKPSYLGPPETKYSFNNQILN